LETQTIYALDERSPTYKNAPASTTTSIGVDLTGILGRGTHGGTYYKSPAVEAKKTHFPTLQCK